MRADRLVSLVLLLRQRGRMSATALARELEVTSRTVLRDIDALSTAGVPVYAERGRNGGFALLPGFRAELTGLTHDESLALLVAGARRGAHAFGLDSALASAMLKVVDALPDSQRTAVTAVTERLLIDPETDLLSRRVPTEELATEVVTTVRRAVVDGRQLRIRHRAGQRPARWSVVDPIGMVTVRETTYLLASRDGEDRTYRLSRIQAAELLDQPTDRPDIVDLEQLWRDRSTTFRAGGDQVTVLVRLRAARREEVAATALAVLSETELPETVPAETELRQTIPAETAWLELEVTFQDLRHAVWAMWQLGTDAEVVAPQAVRDELRERAAVLAGRYA